MAYDNIRLEKGMYAHPVKSFSEVLEEIDPSANYKGAPEEGLDAFQRQLKRFNIKVSGAGSDAVQKFFATADSTALFPEYVSRAVRQGIEEANMLENIVATKTHIEGMDYRTIASVPTEAEKSLQDVNEGDLIPETTVRVQENLVQLKKRGRMLVASYEAIRFQRLDLFTVTLRQIGAYIARQQFKDAVEVILNGDGNQNPAAEISAAGGGSLAYADLLTLWNGFDPYELNTLVASPDMMMQMLQIEEFKNPQTGLNFQGTGKLTTPLGANLLKSAAVPDDKIIGLDNRCALEMVVASDVRTDYDKLIDRQLERAVISCIAGFAKIFGEASKVLKV